MFCGLECSIILLVSLDAFICQAKIDEFGNLAISNANDNDGRSNDRFRRKADGPRSDPEFARHPKDWPVVVPYEVGAWFEPGETIFFHGKMNSRFTLDVLSGSKTGGGKDISLRVRVESSGTIFLNTMKDKSWGSDETMNSPIKGGDSFDLRIRVFVDKFEIFANQKRLGEYKARLPFANIRGLKVLGGVMVNGLYHGGGIYELPYSSALAAKHTTQKSLRVDERVFVRGIFSEKALSFEILFYGGQFAGDILFRFKPLYDGQKIEMDSRIDEKWSSKEEVKKFPFERNVGFDLVFIHKRRGFEVYCAKELLATYAHRSKDQDYQRLLIKGDIDLTAVEIFGS